MTIGERIKEARKMRGLTQAQLGARCSMAGSAIRRYESDRGNPTLETLQRIADALGMPPEDLVGEKLDPTVTVTITDIVGLKEHFCKEIEYHEKQLEECRRVFQALFGSVAGGQP